jgi:hypothetical protein
MNSIDTTYYWRVSAHDPYVDDLVTTKTYHFTTVENAPYISNPVPANDIIRVPIETSEISIDLADYPDHDMDYSIETVPDVGSISVNNVGDGTYTLDLDPLSYFTTYTWFVNVTDGTHWTRKEYSFMTEPESIVADQDFNDSENSDDLRDNGVNQDWYVSFGNSNLITLNTSTVGENTGKKAKFEGSEVDSVYLSQEFIQNQSENFKIGWDIYIDKIINISGNPDRAGWIFIGDDSNGLNGPCSTDNECFVYLAFVKDGGGDNGTMDLMAFERYGSWTSFTIIEDNLLLDLWYNIEVEINFELNRYTVFVDGEHKRTIKPRTFKDEITHISFAQLENGAGTFFVDNVYSSALD